MLIFYDLDGLLKETLQFLGEVSVVVSECTLLAYWSLVTIYCQFGGLLLNKELVVFVCWSYLGFVIIYAGNCSY